ncbi:MAG: hypothetical protein WBB07_17490 [Mycobacterium sp.]
MPELNPDGTVSDGTVYEIPAEPTTTEVRAQAIAACTRCDAQGYRGTLVCDHTDRDTRHGRELMRAELAKIRKRQADRARTESPAVEP